ncbi:cryptochrome/photolyase family protein [Aquimarina rhabdastrellae]
MKQEISIFWFRRDLRFEDNVGLYQALKDQYKVLPIFIFDENILEKLPKNDARVQFIVSCLQDMQLFLQDEFNSSVAIFHGKPLAIFEELCNQYTIAKVYTNHDYEPYAIQRDHEIETFLTTQGIAFESFKDQVIYEKNEISKGDNTPYVVYTPYMKAWMKAYQLREVSFYPSEILLNNLYTVKHKQITLESIGFKTSIIKVKPHIVSRELIINYGDTRDYPAKSKGTSGLSTHLRFGTVSIRKLIDQVIKEENKVFCSELIWREFFMQILWHFPHTINKSFRAKYDRIKWRNNEEDFERWKNGETGFPLVDAGMRELNETGLMHNRVRMLVASFLCKHLLIDWRWGEAYFAEKLLDFDLSANVGNWQWVAGSGVDAAPYFRIFNPTTQIQKFDKDLNYVRKWVKDFDQLTYLSPMIDHKYARKRCLETYKEALS